MNRRRTRREDGFPGGALGWGGPDGSSDADVKGPSRTALSVARLRAMHQLHDADPKVLNDPVSPRLMGDVALDRRTDELRLHVVLRSRYAEDRLAMAVRAGVRQCVILGAGYDTLAYRQQEWARDVTFFEVDAAATQRDKRERLSAASVTVPDNLSFVPMDFESENLSPVLAGAGFDATRAAFFSWLGVTMYVKKDAVDAVLRFVATCAPDSEIVFTFAQPETGVGFAAWRALAAGEPWRTFYATAELDAKLAGMGFAPVEFLTPELATQRYALNWRADGLRPPSRTAIVSARVH